MKSGNRETNLYLALNDRRLQYLLKPQSLVITIIQLNKKKPDCFDCSQIKLMCLLNMIDKSNAKCL